MAWGHSSGCHRCGGYPGHPQKNRAFLSVCEECHTYTCNEHTTLMGACPKCKSGKMRKVLTSSNIRKEKKGGMVDVNSIPSEEEISFGEGGGGITPSFGGGVQSQSSGPKGPALEGSAEDHLPQEVREIRKHILDETHEHKKTSLTSASFEKEEHSTQQQLLSQGVRLPLKGAAYSDLDDFFENKVNTPTPSQTGLSGAKGTREGLASKIIENHIQEEQKNSRDSEEDKGEEITKEERLAVDEAFAALSWTKRLNVKNTPFKELQSIAEAKEGVAKIFGPAFIDTFWSLTDGKIAESVERYLDGLPENTQNHILTLLSFEPQKTEEALSGLSSVAKKEQFFYAMGFGPRAAQHKSLKDQMFFLKKNIVLENKALVIGEVGLDLHYAPYTLQLQKELLLIQLKIAAEKNFPVLLTQKKAVKELKEVLEEHTKTLPDAKPLRFIYTGLLETDAMLELVEKYDMHVCLRPELTYELHKEALARTKKVKSVRLLTCGAGALSLPSGARERYNTPALIVRMLAPFFTKAFEWPDENSLLKLCLANWARLMLGTPLQKENERLKEDLWAEFR